MARGGEVIDGHATSLGAASGVVAGLVGITPGAGFMGVAGAMAVGAAAGALCALAIRLKFKFGFDDALDVVGVHLVGGLVGGLLIGFFAFANNDAGIEGGLFEGGGIGLLLEQIFANAFVGIFSFCGTWLIAKAIDSTIGLRVTPEDERLGLDQSQHAENAYS